MLELELELLGPWGGQAQGSEGGGSAGGELEGFWLCKASCGLWSCPLWKCAWLQAGREWAWQACAPVEAARHLSCWCHGAWRELPWLGLVVA